MAVNVNDVKVLVEALANKDQKTTYVSAANFNRYAKAAQLDIINEQRMVFEAGTISSDNMASLKVKKQINVDTTTGTFSTPADYLYLSAMYVNTYNVNKRGEVFAKTNPIEPVTDSELGNRLSSMFETPTKQRPIAIEYDGSITVYPNNVGLIDLVYIKQPADPTWAFTVSGNVQVYDSGNSVDFEISDQLRNDLVYKICQYLGVTVQQADLFQASQMLKANQ